MFEVARWWEFEGLAVDWTEAGAVDRVIEAARGQNARPSLKVTCAGCNGAGRGGCEDCADGDGWVPPWQYDPALTGVEPGDARAAAL